MSNSMRALLLAGVRLSLTEWNGLAVEDQAALVVAGHELRCEQAELVAQTLVRLSASAAPVAPAKPVEPPDRAAVLAALERAAREAQNAHAQVGAS